MARLVNVLFSLTCILVSVAFFFTMLSACAKVGMEGGSEYLRRSSGNILEVKLRRHFNVSY